MSEQAKVYVVRYGDAYICCDTNLGVFSSEQAAVQLACKVFESEPEVMVRVEVWQVDGGLIESRVLPFYVVRDTLSSMAKGVFPTKELAVKFAEEHGSGTCIEAWMKSDAIGAEYDSASKRITVREAVGTVLIERWVLP